MIRYRSAALAACVLLLCSCSDGGSANSDTDTTATTAETEATKTAITQEQASVLADVLVKNNDLGGADVTATVPYGVATFTMTGTIDWANHLGRVTVSTEVSTEANAEANAEVEAKANAKPTTSFDIAFTGDTVYEQVDGLADALVATDRAPAGWVVRSLDPSTSPLDVVLSLLNTSTSIQRDNPVLLISNGTTYLGSATLDGVNDGVETDRFESGRTNFWVGHDDGRLYRESADLDATDSTAVIDFSNHGPRTIELPAATDTVAIDEVADLYRQLRGA